MGHHHRSAQKQRNKPFKRSSAKPKSLKEKRKAAGAKLASAAINRHIAKADRLQHSRQRRLLQRCERQKWHSATGGDLAPKVVALLPFSHPVCIDKIFSALSKELLADDGDDALRRNEMEMDVVQEGALPRTSEFGAPLADSHPQHCRYLFSLPSYARNAAVSKKRLQQVLLLPAPRVTASAPTSEDTMHQEECPSNRPSELLRYMDLCSTCDVLVCIFGGNCSYDNSAFSAGSYEVLQALKLQGLPPTVIGVGCTDTGVLEQGHSWERKTAPAESLKFMRRFFESELGAERKFFSVGEPADWRHVVRALGAAAALTQMDTVSKSLAKGAEAAACRRRGHMIALDWHITWRPPTEASEAEPEPCLEVIGLVRGAGLTCRLPVHVTGVGDFVVSRIESLGKLQQARRREPFVQASSTAPENESLGTDLEGVLEASQPLQPLDMAALEQTWPTGEEMEEDEDPAAGARSKRVRVPKNVGDYERAWLESETEGSSNASVVEDGVTSDAEMQTEDITVGDKASSIVSLPDGPEDDWKPLSAADQQQMRADNEAYAAQRREAAEMEKKFPDQIDTPLNIPAKERFQKYRGLKSFRSSPWAKNEDLPLGYSRIIDVASLKGLAAHAHRAHAELCRKTGGFSGRFCRLWLPLRHSYLLQQLVQQQPPLKGTALDEALVSTMARRLASRFEVQRQDAAVGRLCSAADDLMVPDFLVLSQLLQHESQVAVVHSQVTFCDKEPVKCKDPVVLACGFRRFPAAPIFSEEPRQGVRSAAKWKFKRWGVPGTTLTATVYAPLVLPPSPCLMLRADDSAPGGLRISAWGSVLPVNGASSRLIIKRVLLSGHPFKVHKRKAVVRFMFFNPDDVRWFAPIELHTKRGLRGNIVEPLGTHGYMKCKFSDYLKQSDEVLLPLYRRVFPKWFPESWGGLPNQQPTE